jgi:hypothetical protein
MPDMKHPPWDPNTLKLLQEEDPDVKLIRLLKKADFRDVRYGNGSPNKDFPDIFYQNGWIMEEVGAHVLALPKHLMWHQQLCLICVQFTNGQPLKPTF